MAGRWLKLIGRVVILILVVVVALQNRRGVQLRAFWWALPHVPLAVVVLLAVLLGIILGGLGVWWGWMRTGSGHQLASSAPTLEGSYPTTTTDMMSTSSVVDDSKPPGD